MIPLIPKPKQAKQIAQHKPSNRQWMQPRPVVPTLTDRANTFVYLITDETFCKIGFAKDLSQRLASLQHATPYDLRLMNAVETDQPRALESFLHGLFASKHYRLEWFRLIAMDEWLDAVSTAQELVATTISSGIPSVQQDVLNTGSN